MSIASRQADAKSHANDSIFWLIEKTGTMRQVWGPYTLGQARGECGTRHTVIRGSGLSNAQLLSQGVVQAAIESGRIWTIDGEDLM